MAGKDKLKKERQKSKFAAMEALRAQGGFPVPARKAMSRAKKTSKKLAYPLPPYAGANLLQLYRWGQFEWHNLGRWQRLAAPIVLLVALLTWEKERAMQDQRWDEIEQHDTRRMAAELYGAHGPSVYAQRTKRRKLLGIIPLPGGKK